MREPIEHDYTRRYWGHDYTFKPIDGGLTGEMTGWGNGIRAGDRLILANGDRSTRYRVMKIRYERDPDDMWHAKVEFAPRTAEVA